MDGVSTVSPLSPRVGPHQCIYVGIFRSKQINITLSLTTPSLVIFVSFCLPVIFWKETKRCVCIQSEIPRQGEWSKLNSVTPPHCSRESGDQLGYSKEQMCRRHLRKPISNLRLLNGPDVHDKGLRVPFLCNLFQRQRSGTVA